MSTRTSSRVVRLAIAGALTTLALGTGAAVTALSPASASTTTHVSANNPWPGPTLTASSAN